MAKIGPRIMGFTWSLFLLNNVVIGASDKLRACKHTRCNW
jgi:hypothetical protein